VDAHIAQLISSCSEKDKESKGTRKIRLGAEQIPADTCRFLNIPFDSKLVDKVTAPSGIVVENEYWKNRNLDQHMVKKSNAEKRSNMLKLKRYIKKKLRTSEGPERKISKAIRNQQNNLYQTCLKHFTPITVPLALISQIQRSGGSLLSQLFDGHPEIYAHPDELKIGYPKKDIWPEIDLNDSPKNWFNILFEEKVIRHSKEGYTKGYKSDKRFPFIFFVSVQKKIFFKYLAALESVTPREIFNAYMSSYFGSWLNYQNIFGAKKFITGFTPRLSMSEENMEFFFKIYPDGRLISIIRDPRNWFPSAARHNIHKYGYEDPQIGLKQWNESALMMLKNKDKYKDRVIIISFEDLIQNTEPVMRSIADFLDIEFDDILTVPTFNKLPIVANTSFKVETANIMHGTLSRYQTLTQKELDIIDKMSHDIYEKVLGVADRPGDPGVLKN
jgi:hypothetical protein